MEKVNGSDSTGKPAVRKSINEFRIAGCLSNDIRLQNGNANFCVVTECERVSKEGKLYVDKQLHRFTFRNADPCSTEECSIEGKKGARVDVKGRISWSEYESEKVGEYFHAPTFIVHSVEFPDATH